MTTENEQCWVIRMQLRESGYIRTISKTLTHDQAIDFLSKVSAEYYGYKCPRIWAHDTTDSVPIWEKNEIYPSNDGYMEI